MVLDSRIVDLLVRYEDGKGRGEELTPDELCRDFPELLPQLRAALEAVARIPDPSTRHTLSEDNATKRYAKAAASESPDRADALGSRRFAVVRPHARGGLGEVLVAEDRELQREVAFKRIKPQLASNADARRRFLREAKITARLEHPGIVPIYGLVEDETGQPSYAMRFVQGESLGEAIRRFHDSPQPWNGLAFRQLLQQFITVCRTMAYVHDRGIIHRDLKPANVMLGKYGETLVVDWGLAKSIEQPDGEPGAETPPDSDAQDDRTRLGHAIGTPSYMPPEQAAGQWNIVGPVSDVYSLGATLYELLTGTRPVHGNDLADVLSRVQRGEFPAPRQVRADVPRPLEAICLKAMARQPHDRYATAQAMADDVENWLADESVSVYREPGIARLARWARKHPARVGMIGTGLITATLALTIGLAIVGQLNTRLDVANRDLRDSNIKLDGTISDLRETNSRLDVARREAEERLAHVEKSNEALTSVFRDLDPRVGEKEGESLKVQLGSRLEQVAATLHGEAVGDPQTVARLQTRLAISLIHLGRYPSAIDLLGKAHSTLASLAGPDHADTLDAANQLVSVLRAAGRLDEALALGEETLRRRKTILGPDHNDTATSTHNLAMVYRDKGWNDRALPMFLESFQQLKSKLGPDHRQTLTAMNNLAVGYLTLDRRADALPLTRELFLRMKSTLGPDHPDTIAVMNTLALVTQAEGRSAEALPMIRDTYQQLKAKLGPDHPDTLVSMNNLAFLLQAAGNLSDALSLYTEALKLFDAKLGPEHLNTLMARYNLAYVLHSLGRLTEALPLYEKTLTSMKATAGPDHTATLMCMANLGVAYRAAGRTAEALPLLEESLKRRNAVLGPDHTDTLTSMNELAFVLGVMARHDEAIRLCEEILKRRRSKNGPDHRQTLQSMNNLAMTLRNAKRLGEALTLAEDTLKRRRQALGPEDRDTLFSMNLLGNLQLMAGRPADAVKTLRQSLADHQRLLGKDAPETIYSMHDLAMALMAGGELDQSIALHDETLRKRREKLGPNHADTVLSLGSLATATLLARKHAQAEPLFRELLAQQRPKLPAHSPQLANILGGLGLCLLEQKKYAEAEPVARENLAIREKVAPADWGVFNARSMLGGSLLGQRKYADAEPLLLAGYEGMKQRENKIPPNGKPRLTESLERLVQLYDALGKKDKADQWRQLLNERKRQ